MGTTDSPTGLCSRGIYRGVYVEDDFTSPVDYVESYKGSSCLISRKTCVGEQEPCLPLSWAVRCVPSFPMLAAAFLTFFLYPLAFALGSFSSYCSRRISGKVWVQNVGPFRPTFTSAAQIMWYWLTHISAARSKTSFR